MLPLFLYESPCSFVDICHRSGGTCFLHSQVKLIPWRWRLQVTPKLCYLFTKLYLGSSQNIVTLIFTALKLHISRRDLAVLLCLPYVSSWELHPSASLRLGWPCSTDRQVVSLPKPWRSAFFVKGKVLYSIKQMGRWVSDVTSSRMWCCPVWQNFTDVSEERTLSVLTTGGIHLRHYATIRNVASSIPDEVIGFFNWPHPSSRTMAVGLTQPLTEMSTRNLTGSRGQSARKADILTGICESIT
jgi:hypothetical protein